MSIFGRSYGQKISGEVLLHGKPTDVSTHIIDSDMAAELAHPVVTVGADLIVLANDPTAVPERTTSSLNSMEPSASVAVPTSGTCIVASYTRLLAARPST
jgi:hypothetical protein